MNISTDLMDGGIAKVTVEVSASDYQEELDKKLQQYRREIDMPGFRKGKVPMGIVRKQVGSQVVQEVVGLIIDRAIAAHMDAENLKPIYELDPIITTPDGEFDPNADRHTYVCEFALFPEFILDLDAELAKVPSYRIVVTEADVDNEIEEYRRMYSKSVEKNGPSEEGNAIEGVFSNREYGIESDTEMEISDEVFADPAILQRFVGKKPGDVIPGLSTKNLLAEGCYWVDYLDITDEQEEILEADGTEMDFAVSKVCTIEPAALEPDFFNRIFGTAEEKIETYERFRALVKTTLEEELPSLEKKRFMDDVLAHLQYEVPFELPEEYLKRVYDRKKADTDMVDSYFHFVERIRESVVFSKIAEECGLKPTQEEVLDYTIEQVSRNAELLGRGQSEKQAAAKVSEILSDRKQLADLLSDLEMEKVMELIESKFDRQNRQEISCSDFWEDYEEW